MSMIHCIGDSHASFFCGEDRIARSINDNASRYPWFKVYHVGPVLAYSLCKTGTRTGGREIILGLLKDRIPAGSRILFCFGEIDCRFHLLRQAELQGRSLQAIIDECVERYVGFALEIKSRGYDVNIWNATPSAPDSLPMDRAFPRYGTARQRNLTTRMFNQLVIKKLEHIGISFINIFDTLVDEHGETRLEYLMDQIHLSQRAMPLALKEINSKYKYLSAELLKMDELKVFFGPHCPQEDWLKADYRLSHDPGQGNQACRLSDFEDDSVDEIFGANVMSLLDYKGELPAALKEMHRVLKPGGKLRVSLPDFETLCRLFLDPRLSTKQRFHIMRLMFGARLETDETNQVGLSWEFLLGFLNQAGFKKARRVEAFGLCDDYSDRQFFGYPLYMKVEAVK